MFSMTTMELSTSMPMPSASPDREMMFNVTPLKYMQTMAVTRLIGMENATTRVGLMSFRKRIRIRIASPPPNRILLRMASITRSI